MKKLILFIFTILLFSCSKKEVLLPQVDKTIISKVEDLSPIYIFFKTEGKDTIADLNRSNSISSTNWIFNIDKRLPLRLVISELIFMQNKKEKSMHKSETAENYFSYSDNIKKSLAFIPFTKVNYKLEKPKFGKLIYFTKNNTVNIENESIEKEKLLEFITNLPSDKPLKFLICFDKNLSYNDYIKYKVFIELLYTNTKSSFLFNEEFIY